MTIGGDYSFQDYNISILTPAGGITTFGAGVGSGTITMNTDKTTQNVAADGVVLHNFIAGDNGTFTLTMQQTSFLNGWLKAAYNTMKLLPKALWSTISIQIANLVNVEYATLNGCSFQKLPDKPMQAEAQMVSWVFLCKDVQQQDLL